MTGPPPEITGMWLHCHEEDTASAMVFRRREYPLPPARWRDAIELRADGTCVWHGSSPDDRGQAARAAGRILETGRQRSAALGRGRFPPPDRSLVGP